MIHETIDRLRVEVKRDQLQQILKEKRIQTAIHYPIPPYLQKAYVHLGYNKGDFPITERLAETSLSLPLYPGLNTESVNYICNSINEFFKNWISVLILTAIICHMR